MKAATAPYIKVRVFYAGMQVPFSFWSEAILTACYLINRMHSRVLNGKSPFFVLLPDYIIFHLVPRVFGCVAFENVLHPPCEKFDNRSIPCVFLGYSPGKKGYKCMNPKDGLVYL